MGSYGSGFKKRVINGLGELELALHSIWNNIAVQNVLNLIETMPRRINASIKAGAGHLEY